MKVKICQLLSRDPFSSVADLSIWEREAGKDGEGNKKNTTSSRTITDPTHYYMKFMYILQSHYLESLDSESLSLSILKKFFKY